MTDIPEEMEEEPCIEFNDKLVALWFMSLNDHTDWLAAISEVVPEEKYKLVYRFRYYRDEKAFDSKDEKHWFRGVLSGKKAFCMASVRELARRLQAKSTFPDTYYEQINDQGIEQFQQKFNDAPFVFIRLEKAEPKPTGHCALQEKKPE